LHSVPESRCVGLGSTCWASCSFPIRAAIRSSSWRALAIWRCACSRRGPSISGRAAASRRPVRRRIATAISRSRSTPAAAGRLAGTCRCVFKVQRGGYAQHLGRLALCRPLIDPVGDGVAPVPEPPLGLGFLPVQHPALRFAAHPLPRSYARIGSEPLSADTAGFLPQIRHG
jgi:hypothetical protein